MNVSSFRQHRAHHFPAVHLTRTKQDTFEFFVRMRFTIEDPTSSIASQNRKWHLETHNTAARDQRRAMSIFITYYDVNMTDEALFRKKSFQTSLMTHCQKRLIYDYFYSNLILHMYVMADIYRNKTISFGTTSG